MNDSWLKETLRATLYSIWSHASHTDKLCDHLFEKKAIRSVLSSAATPAEAVGKLVEVLTNGAPNIIANEDDAIASIVASKVAETSREAIVSTTESYIVDERDIQKFLNAQLARSVDAFNAIGLTLGTWPSMVVVDEYPKPFDNLKGTALAPDVTDQQRFGLPNAIYFRRSAFSPVAASMLIPHELVHKFIPDDGLIARGVEEGIADFMSLCVIGPTILPTNYIMNRFSTRRLGLQDTPQRFRAYADYMRRAYLIHSSLGTSGLVQLVKDGRRAIKEFERKLFVGVGDRSPGAAIPIPMADELCLNALEHEHLSASAFALLLARSSRIASRIDQSLEKVALQELEDVLFILLRNEKGEIEFDDTEHVVSDRWCRFRV